MLDEKAVAGLGNRRACAPLAGNAEGCPPRLIGGSKIKPLIRRVLTKQKTKPLNSIISVILYQTAKAD